MLSHGFQESVENIDATFPPKHVSCENKEKGEGIKGGEQAVGNGAKTRSCEKPHWSA